MTTPAQLIAAAKLVDKKWGQGNEVYGLSKKYCPVTATRSVVGEFAPIGPLWAFEGNSIASLNDAPDCTKDAAVMFLLLCAEARKQGDL